MKVEEIDKAIAAHRTWRTRLKQTAETGVSEIPVATIRVKNECAFGKWLYGNSFTPDEKNSQHYKKVADLHARFHESAATIATLATTGKKAEADKMLALDGEFMTLASNLTAAMMAWKGSLTSVAAR